MTLKNIKITRFFFKQIKSIKEGYKAQNCIMTDQGGNLITETRSILNLFQEYCKRILNNKYVEEISYKNQKNNIRHGRARVQGT